MSNGTSGLSTANVKVAIRIRPISVQESIEGEAECIAVLDGGNNKALRQCLIGKNHAFSFDYIFEPHWCQKDIFASTTLPLIERFLEGYNATIFAYGQTGSGKTYTMGTGIDGSMDDTNLGVVPRAIEEIFKALRNAYPEYHPTTNRDIRAEDRPYMLYSSFLEIYNEEVKDLLNPSSGEKTKQDGTGRPPLVIREDASGEIYLAGCQEEEISAPEELFHVLRKGTLCRSTGSTDMNLTSSRSHAIFTLILRQRKVAVERGGEAEGGPVYKNYVSKFNFVDLAGSERLKRTRAVGHRAKEAISINSGLLALGNVISTLSDTGGSKTRSHVPYRDSKLTRLLQNSLGGNSQTLMMACVSGAECNYQESLNTLRYASRARSIQNRVSVNEDGAGSVFEIAQLKKQVMNLKQELLLLKSGSYHQQQGGSSSMALGGRSIEKRLGELMSENVALRLKLDLANSGSAALGLDAIMGSPPIIEMVGHLQALRSKVLLLESTGTGTPHPPGTPSGSPGGSRMAQVMHRARDELQRHLALLALDSDDGDGDTADELQRLSNDELRSALRSVREDMLLKQELVSGYERLREDYTHMKVKYEEKLSFLQESLNVLRKEAASARPGPGSGVGPGGSAYSSKTGQLNKIARDKYESRIQKLSRELEDARERERVTELKRRSGGDSAAGGLHVEAQLEALRGVVGAQRVEKSRLVHSMTEEMSRLRLVLSQREAECKEWKLAHRDALDEAKTYKRHWETSRAMLQKRTRPVAATGKRMPGLVGRSPVPPARSPRPILKKGGGGGGKAVSFVLPASIVASLPDTPTDTPVYYHATGSPVRRSPSLDATEPRRALFPPPLPQGVTDSPPRLVSPRTLRKNTWILTRNDIISSLHTAGPSTYTETSVK